MAALRLLSSRHEDAVHQQQRPNVRRIAAQSRRQVLQKAHRRRTDLCRRLCSCLFMGRVVTACFFRSTWSPFGA